MAGHETEQLLRQAALTERASTIFRSFHAGAWDLGRWLGDSEARNNFVTKIVFILDLNGWPRDILPRVFRKRKFDLEYKFGLPRAK